MKPTIDILIHSVMKVIEEFPMELSYNDFNLFLNLLWTPRSSLKASGGPVTHIEGPCCNFEHVSM